MATNTNLWLFWAKKLHIVDMDNNEWFGYCDEVCGIEGTGLVLEIGNEYRLFGKSQIRLIEVA